MGIVRKEFNYVSADCLNNIYACLWTEESAENYKGIVQISHGMAEHILRYEDFAMFLAEQGYLVCGNDHLGHGNTATNDSDLGFFGDECGSWNYLIHDMHYLMEFIKDRYPNIPYFILGHSMGSFLAREFVFRYGSDINGAVFLGTSGGNILIDVAIALSNRGIKIKSTREKGYSVNKLAFKPFNIKFRPIRTDFDWISSDEKVVDKFVADKKCGFVFTYAGYRDLFELLKCISKEKWAEGIPKKLPILLLSGDNDPVGDYGKGVEKVYERLLNSGCENVVMKLYEGGRHEMLNEKNKNLVYRFILKWLNDIIIEIHL